MTGRTSGMLLDEGFIARSFRTTLLLTLIVGAGLAAGGRGGALLSFLGGVSLSGSVLTMQRPVTALLLRGAARPGKLLLGLVAGAQLLLLALVMAVLTGAPFFTPVAFLAGSSVLWFVMVSKGYSVVLLAWANRAHLERKDR